MRQETVTAIVMLVLALGWITVAGSQYYCNKVLGNNDLLRLPAGYIITTILVILATTLASIGWLAYIVYLFWKA